MLKQTIIVLLIVLLLWACSSTSTEEAQECPLPTQGFSELDLVGTWGEINPRMDSIIILRKDGRYKQFMYVERTDFSYESDWLPWRLEYAESSLPYLHLEGLLMCAYWSSMDCDEKDVGETLWYDFCQEKWVDTPGEGIFMVFGEPDERFVQPPRGVRLVPFTKSTDGITGPVYELTEP